MLRDRMRRAVPLLLIVALCLAPLTVAEAGGHGSKLVGSQGLLDWAGLLWQRLLNAWGQEGGSIDPSGANPPANGNGSTTPSTLDRAWGQEGASIDPSGGNPPINGNGSTTPTPIDPSNG